MLGIRYLLKKSRTFCLSAAKFFAPAALANTAFLLFLAFSSTGSLLYCCDQAGGAKTVANVTAIRSRPARAKARVRWEAARNIPLPPDWTTIVQLLCLALATRHRLR